MIPILLAATSVRSQQSNFYHPQQSAASEAQIRFAKENKYDDTGPGAKGPEYAYSTFKRLEDALVGYVDDPDTKLPEFEKAKGIQQLYRSQQKEKPLFKANPFLLRPSQTLKGSLLRHEDTQSAVLPFKQSETFSFLPEEMNTKVEQIKVLKLQPVKSSPLNLAHFTRDSDVDTNNLNSSPSYTYSYGVHGKLKRNVVQKNQGTLYDFIYGIKFG
ncbi:unnamed protein product [Diatraea saccharalis]|uniref:Uncharacterized protein n=1 Tax=Diatraea saccharalis TaxID=40085 RepID=A0A9N9R0S1_9NEOP|nr:unnamed protein product [Diatraea saccharalis]